MNLQQKEHYFRNKGLPHQPQENMVKQGTNFATNKQLLKAEENRRDLFKAMCICNRNKCLETPIACKDSPFTMNKPERKSQHLCL